MEFPKFQTKINFQVKKQLSKKKKKKNNYQGAVS